MSEVLPNEVHLNEAREALRANRLDQADTLVRAVLDEDPHSVGGLNVLGTVEIRRGRPLEAARHFAVAADHDIGPRSAMNLAMALDIAGSRDKAAAQYAALLSRFPDHHAARTRLIKVLFAIGDAVGALRVSRSAANDFSPDAETCTVLALCCLAVGDAQEARLWIDRTLSLDPTAMRAVLIKAGWLIAEKRYGEAVDMLRPLQETPGTGSDRTEIDTLLGRALKGLGRIEEALPYLLLGADEPAARADLHRQAGNALRKQGRNEPAVEQFRAVLAIQPDDWQVAERLAKSLMALKRDKEAIEILCASLEREPTEAAAWNALSIELKTAGDKQAAARFLCAACIRFPDISVLLYNAGLTLNELSRAEDAEVHLRRAVTIDPKYAKAWNSLSVALSVQFRAAEAMAAAEESLRLDRKSKSAWMNYAITLRAQGQFGGSAVANRQALRIDPKYPEANHNLAITFLLSGEIEQGFRYYDWRFALPEFSSPKRPFRQPEWQGEDLSESGMVVYMEQGMGDEIMFSWYLRHLSRQTRHLIVDCDPRLVSLFARSFPGVEFVPRAGKPHPRTKDPVFAYKLPSGHLPKFFWSETREHIYRTCQFAGQRYLRTEGYLHVDPVRQEYWRNYLNERAEGRPLVGISWRSGLHSRTRDIQYLSPDEIARAMGGDVAVINLQYGHQDEELEALKRAGREYGFRFIHPEGIDLKDDLDDVMALLSVLDLVVSPLISVPWMAGALGVPAWVFRTSEVSRIWQQLGMPYVPWCPSLRLFFRHPLAPWDGLIDAVRSEMAEWLETR